MFLLDNDVINKLARCDLFRETQVAYDLNQANTFILPTLKFRFKLLEPDKGHSKCGGPAAFRIMSTIVSRDSQPISDQPSVMDLAKFQGVINIDAGEAILFLVSANTPGSVMMTGDKRSIRALASNAVLMGTFGPLLQGKIVCFEQIMMKLIQTGDFAAIRAKVVPNKECDTVLRSAFGSGLDSNRDAVEDVFNGHIDALRKEAEGLLAL